MRRVFVYEYLSGGGTIEDDPQATAELLPMGLAMRDAMVLDLLCTPDCAVTVAHGAGVAPALPGAAAAMPLEGEAPLAFVRRHGARHDAVWLVAPETGGLLAALAGAVPPAHWLGCRPEAISLASSKSATVRHLHAQGIATPLAPALAAQARRWVLKPDDGAGAVDTRVYGEQHLAREAQATRPEGGRWLEPWVEGEPLSLSLRCDAHGAELLSVNRQHIEIDATGAVHFRGVSVNVVGPDDPRRPALAAFAQAVAQALPGLHGFVGIDLVWHAVQGPVLIEINPRVTNAYVGLSASLKRNIAAELLAAPRLEAAHA